MREIVLDTETTGLDAWQGDRLVEIGCLELLNHIPTGATFHTYLDPQREVPAEAVGIHGLSTEFLSGKPLFADKVDEFLEFIGDATLVIHNAAFDTGFLNMELERVGRPPLARERIVDTLALARRKHPGTSNSLDALCQRYGIDKSARLKHGALIDAELLAAVYIELREARQARFGLEAVAAARLLGGRFRAVPTRPAPLAPRLDDGTLAAHRAFVATLGANAIWTRYPDDLGETDGS